MDLLVANCAAYNNGTDSAFLIELAQDLKTRCKANLATIAAELTRLEAEMQRGAEVAVAAASAAAVAAAKLAAAASKVGDSSLLPPASAAGGGQKRDQPAGGVSDLSAVPKRARADGGTRPGVHSAGSKPTPSANVLLAASAAAAGLAPLPPVVAGLLGRFGDWLLSSGEATARSGAELSTSAGRCPPPPPSSSPPPHTDPEHQ